MQKFLLFCFLLPAIWLQVGITHGVAAQAVAPWEAAEQIRRALFEAQKALLLDNTTKAQAQVQTARDIFDKSLLALLVVAIGEAWLKWRFVG